MLYNLSLFRLNGFHRTKRTSFQVILLFYQFDFVNVSLAARNNWGTKVPNIRYLLKLNSLHSIRFFTYDSFVLILFLFTDFVNVSLAYWGRFAYNDTLFWFSFSSHNIKLHFIEFYCICFALCIRKRFNWETKLILTIHIDSFTFISFSFAHDFLVPLTTFSFFAFFCFQLVRKRFHRLFAHN